MTAHRLRILQLEDDPADAELIRVALEDAGLEAEVVQVQGREGFLAALDSGQYDVVLSDYALPSFNGLAAIQEVRRRQPDVPVILVSGTLGEERAVEALKGGATDFITKQHLSRLGAAVRRALDEARERAARREAEAALAESQAFLQRVIDATPNLVYVYDLDLGRSVYSNPQAESMIGYTPDELAQAGDLRRAIAHPDDRAALEETHARMRGAVDGQVFENEYRVRHARGEWRWLKTRRVPFRREGGRVRQVLGVAIDVTQSHRAGQRRDAQHALTAILVENAPWEKTIASVLGALSRALEWDLGEMWTKDAEGATLRCDALWHRPELAAGGWEAAARRITFRKGSGLPGRAWESGRALWVSDVNLDPLFLRPGLAADLSLASGAAVPVGSGGDVFAVMTFFTRTASDPDRDLLASLESYGAQLGDYRRRKGAEQALRESEEKFRSIVETTAEWIWAIDREGRITYSNPAVQAILGYEPEELIGLNSFDLMHPDDRPRTEAFVSARAAEKKGWRNLTLRWGRRDGGWRHLESDAVPILDASGELAGFRGADRDVTERIQAEARIREQAALLDSAREAILVEDLEGRITYWNRGAERLYGTSAEEAIGRTTSDFVAAGSPRELRQARETALRDGEWSGLLRQHSQEGAAIEVQSHWTLVRDDSGQPHSILVINSDVTEARRLEAKFLRAQRMESVGVLAGGIAHDLNNVLAPILMGMDVLRRKPLDDHGRRILETVAMSARRGADLVRQVLTFARGIEGERVPLNLRHLVSEMERVVRGTFPRSITLRVDIPRDLWSVMGQATPLQQVLMNLCVNARDAMPEGGVLTLSAENVTLDDHSGRPGAHVRLSVSDTGTGIPPEVLDRIFDPFFTTKPVGKGTGLGLSTTLSIVQGHGGIVDVDTAPGRGTTFHVTLPALPAGTPVRGEGGEGETLAGRGELVLVVDDEASVREMVREVLESYGFRVITAAGGRDAVALFRERHEEVRLVITDMAMPGMDGLATLRALRQVDPGVSVILSSGVIDDAAAEQAAAADAILAKPFTARRLLEVLHEVLKPRA